MRQPGVRADARRNRARLVEVAAQAFATGGLSVPMDEIARRAGVGPGTLYRHFPTRDALFEAVVQERLERLVDAARARLDAEHPGEALFEFVDLMVTEAAPKKDLVDALTGAGVDVRARLGATAAELRTQLDLLLARAQRARDVRADVTAADLLALLAGILHSQHASGDHTPADPARALTVVRDGLRTRRPRT
ncbi:helix-turn-helix domain-containing protein [Actinopolymorpha sp. NPDC004070]|uniref:TetR/AcrR family transcriptional regulator n=1 Tax=Actinopolymorpha sp. NPDC004070 TaxID=3154548 RepID=UPI0033BBD202